MDPTGIPLFALADQRLAWLDRRQNLLSENVANADTPGYKPRDLAPFANSLARASFAVAPARTDPSHLAGSVAPDTGTAGAQAGDQQSGEQQPDGNAVSLDVQLMRIADTDSAHELVTDLYHTYLGMFRTAIGR